MSSINREQLVSATRNVAMRSTLDQIVKKIALKNATAARESNSVVKEDSWVEFEKRLVQLVRGCRGDYTRIDDPFSGFDLCKGPVPSPMLLKRVYTVFHFRFKKLLLPGRSPLEAVCKAVVTAGSPCTLAHLEAIHETDPDAITTYFSEPQKHGAPPPDSRYSILVYLCLQIDVTTWEDFTKALSCIRWMVETFPFLIDMNSLSMPLDRSEIYRTAPTSILGCVEQGLFSCPDHSADPITPLEYK